MAVKLADQLKLRQENFLDDRQGLATSTDVLLGWDFTKIPIPEGFQVFLLGDWYIYKSGHSFDPTLGYFRKYVEDLGIENIEQIEFNSTYSKFDLTRCYTAKFSDILNPTFWTDENSVNHARPGKITIITDDDEYNGVWVLLDFDYTNPESWHRIPVSWRDETIRGTWTFADTAIFSRNLIAKHITFGDDDSYIDVDEEGKTTAKFYKIIAETSDIKDIDEVLETKIGLVGIGNLLLNTAFEGEHGSTELLDNTNLYQRSDVYSEKKENWKLTTRDWIIQEDSSSITGYSLYLPHSEAQISQESINTLTENCWYVLSWKQRDTIKVLIDEEEIEPIKTKIAEGASEDDLVHYYYKFKVDENKKVKIRFTGGPGNICEIKLEAGLVPTTWSPSSEDTDPVADVANSYEYLKTAFTEYTHDNTVSSVFLKNQIKVGDIINDQVEDVYGGLSGIYSDPRDIMFWSGSTFEKAQDLIINIMRDPDYLDRLSYSELQKLTKIAVTFGFKTIITDLYAIGKFKGEHLDYSGRQIRAFHTISGTIPCYDGTQFVGINFIDGRLDSEKYDALPTTIRFYEYDGTNYTELRFLDGRLLDRSDKVYKIWVGAELEADPDKTYNMSFDPIPGKSQFELNLEDYYPADVSTQRVSGKNYEELRIEDSEKARVETKAIDIQGKPYKDLEIARILGEVHDLYLRFHDGYLVKVSQIMDNSTYYWY